MDPLPFSVPGDADLAHSAVLYRAAPAGRLDCLIVLAHGAGGGQSHPFMVRYARGLAERGIDVVTFDFPYIQRKRSAPDRAPVLESTFRRVISAASSRPETAGDRLFIGGKSMGGRMATHVAAGAASDVPGLQGVVVFGYPLNPPGGPSRRSPDRVSHLARVTVPMLIVQGTRDHFGGPQSIEEALRGAGAVAAAHRVFGVPGGDHSLAAKFDQTVWDQVVAFVSST
jgi:predicted alpha/beta-hydrolase family hydrolase